MNFAQRDAYVASAEGETFGDEFEFSLEANVAQYIYHVGTDRGLHDVANVAWGNNARAHRHGCSVDVHRLTIIAQRASKPPCKVKFSWAHQLTKALDP